MGAFNKVSSELFDNLQLEAGVLLNTFDPDDPEVPTDETIICATTGGVNPTCVPTYTDYGEDIDNVPNNTKELARIDAWECKLAFTALDVTPETIKMALGAADVTTAQNKATSIIPRKELKDADFQTVWWVGDIADGGLCAIKLVNAVSTGGFSLQTTKAGKGQLTCELTGYVSIEDTSEIPMEFYIGEAPGETGETGETGA